MISLAFFIQNSIARSCDNLVQNTTQKESYFGLYGFDGYTNDCSITK
jgi:hypothetical protein